MADSPTVTDDQDERIVTSLWTQLADLCAATQSPVRMREFLVKKLPTLIS